MPRELLVPPVVSRPDGDAVRVPHLPERALDMVMRAVAAHHVGIAPVEVIGEDHLLLSGVRCSRSEVPTVHSSNVTAYSNLCEGRGAEMPPSTRHLTSDSDDAWTVAVPSQPRLHVHKSVPSDPE